MYIKNFIIFIAIIATVYFVLFMIAFAIESMSCKAIGERMGVPYDYSLFSGCMIEVNGHWIPLESYYVKEEYEKGG